MKLKNFQVINACTITIPTDLPPFEPVILTSNASNTTFELFKPNGQINNFDIGAHLLLNCVGNVIESINKNSLELICKENNQWQDVNGTTYDLKQLGCKSIPTSSLQLSSEACADGRGYIFKAGFSYGIKQFATVFEVCYDNITENTIYAHNILNGKGINCMSMQI